MIPKIDLSQIEGDSIPKEEVAKMTEALSQAFGMVLRQKDREYKFAKFISYISEAIALILVFKEVFVR